MKSVKIFSDARIQKIARLLVEHSCKIKKEDTVQINAGIPARPLILEIYRQVILKGAYPRVNIDFKGLNYLYYNNATTEQLKRFPEIAHNEMKKTDAVIYIGAPENRYELATIHPERLAIRSRTVKKISDERMKKRWVIFNYPVGDFAKDSGMSFSTYKNFVFNSCLQDWNALRKKMAKLKKIIDKGKSVRIIGKDTDLSFGIKGRLACIGDGTHNMPDGEVWTAPEENTLNGHITFTFPLIYMGREIKGIKLEFEKGKLKKASAKTNSDALASLVNTDAGASKIGEFGIGCNFKIQKFTKNLLFDEKIGGTVHLALGQAYKECLGKNESAIHIDLIKDLRKNSGGGKIYIDNRLIQKNGAFLI